MSSNAGGRPTIYSDDMAEAIFARLSEGKSLAAICRDAAMPSKRTVLAWVRDREGFAEQYDLARWAAAVEIEGEAEALQDGIKTREEAIAARVKFEILKWRAAVLAPNRYGNRMDLTVEHTFDLAGELGRRRQQVLEGRTTDGGLLAPQEPEE